MSKSQKFQVAVEGETRQVEIVPLERGYEIHIDDRSFRVDDENLGHEDFHSLLIDHKSYAIVTDTISRRDGRYTARVRGKVYEVSVLDELQAAVAGGRAAAQTDGEHAVRSPMPGLIVALSVEEGELVEKGDPVVIIEAMKMQNELTAPISGRVKKIHVEVQQSVESKTELITIEPDGGGPSEEES